MFYFVGVLKPGSETDRDYDTESYLVRAENLEEALKEAHRKGLPQDRSRGHWVDEFEGSCSIS